MAEAAKCPKCSAFIPDTYAQSWCERCGNPLPDEIQTRLPQLVKLREMVKVEEASPATEMSASSTRQIGLVCAVVGLFLFGWGALRWNSVESQFTRGFGGQDNVSVALFVIGAFALVAAMLLGVLSPQQTAPASSNSQEDRLRKLQDLHSKQLISEADFESRKRDILGSI